MDPQDDRRTVILDREQRDWLVAAEDLLVELAQTDVEDPDAVFMCAGELKTIWQAFDLASLSAVPDVQDDDGYEARSASPGACGPSTERGR